MTPKQKIAAYLAIAESPGFKQWDWANQDAALNALAQALGNCVHFIDEDSFMLWATRNGRAVRRLTVSYGHRRSVLA